MLITASRLWVKGQSQEHFKRLIFCCEISLIWMKLQRWVDVLTRQSETRQIVVSTVLMLWVLMGTKDTVCYIIHFYLTFSVGLLLLHVSLRKPSRGTVLLQTWVIGLFRAVLLLSSDTQWYFGTKPFSTQLWFVILTLINASCIHSKLKAQIIIGLI